MSAVQVFVQGYNGAPPVVTFDRVPSPGEYVRSPAGVFKVLATVLNGGNPNIAGSIFVTHDPDNWPDELGPHH